MSLTTEIIAITEDGREVGIQFTEEHDENLCETVFVIDMDTLPKNTMSIQIKQFN